MYDYTAAIAAVQSFVTSALGLIDVSTPIGGLVAAAIVISLFALVVTGIVGLVPKRR